jgi:hypothetical protein
VLNLTGAHFLNKNGDTTATRNIVSSGLNTFKHVNFARLTELSLSSADFSSSTSNDTTAYYTANGTFSYDYFPLLQKIDLNQTEFIRKPTGAFPTVTSGDIHTGYRTFMHAHFGALSTCNLSKTQFADIDMVGNGSVFTADSTFAYASFNIKKSFNFAAIYASPNMVKSGYTAINAQIATAVRTFESADFSQLEEFNLQSVNFAAANMGKLGTLSSPLVTGLSTVDTANLTFYGAMFPSAKKCVINNVTFATQYMIQDAQSQTDADAAHIIVHTASGTFQDLHIGLQLESATSFGMTNITFATSNMVTLGGGS